VPTLSRRTRAREETGLAMKFAGVALLGFGIDAGLLHTGILLGLSPAIARIISLFCAMQVTFTVNGLFVFKCLTRTSIPRHWLGYMASSGVGNFCNYWIFVTLVSLHWSLISNHFAALAVGSLCAWIINYAGARLIVFGPAQTTLGALLVRDSVASTEACETQAPPLT
jgi:putative flippase GtrA